MFLCPLIEETTTDLKRFRVTNKFSIQVAQVILFCPYNNAGAFDAMAVIVCFYVDFFSESFST